MWVEGNQKEGEKEGRKNGSTERNMHECMEKEGRKEERKEREARKERQEKARINEAHHLIYSCLFPWQVWNRAPDCLISPQ
jgi:hypothetical protein